MFFTGILAILQILLFPGLIFLLLFKPKGGVIFKTSVVVAMSMLFNVTLLYPLFYLHLYTRGVIFGLIVLECLVLGYLLRHAYRVNFNQVGKALVDYCREFAKKLADLFIAEDLSASLRVVRGLIIFLAGGFAVSLILWFFHRLINGIGTVFINWDAVVSWNSWAQDWASGRVPSINLTYPQLLPFNLSLTYVLMGNFQVSLFAKAIMPIFALLTVLLIFELAFDQKHYGYLFAVILLYLLYKKFLGDILADGYADVPVAFMALTALTPYLQSENLLLEKKGLILSFLLAVAAALMKQPGIYILVLLPFLILINGKSWHKKEVLLTLSWFGAGVLLILPWYLPVGIHILQGASISGMDAYTSLSSAAQNSALPLQRSLNAVMGLGKYVVVYLFLIPAFFLVPRKFKVLILTFLIPYTFLWGIIASYDTRNLAITFAGVAIVAGLSGERVLDWVLTLLDRIKLGELSSIFLFLLLLLPLIYFSLKWNDARIIEQWRKQQSLIFSPEINEQVNQLFENNTNPDCQKIITNYPVNYLPDLQGRQINSYFNDYRSYQQLLADPQACWILVPSYALDSVKKDIDSHLASGQYTLLFTSTSWIHYELIQIR